MAERCRISFANTETVLKVTGKVVKSVNVIKPQSRTLLISEVCGKKVHLSEAVLKINKNLIPKRQTNFSVMRSINTST
jgi:hypothetical protein